MHKLIHVVGASGSGTTTLGRAISERFGFTHFDSDDYFWLPTNPPYTIKREIPERQSLLTADINKTEKGVISGSLCAWGDILIPKFALVIYLKVPTDIRIARLEKRELKEFGNQILPGGDMHKTYLEFIDWAKTYDTADETSRSAALHKLWLGNLKCPVVEIDGTNNIDAILVKLESYISRI